MDTVFYAAGAALVLIALIVSAIGLRSDDFPSANVLRIGVVLVALVVGFTSYAAVEASEEEELARLEEEDRAAAEEAEEAAAENEAEGVSGSDDVNAADEDVPPQGEATASSADGATVFIDNGCGGCHTLADLPEAVGEIGPNLDAQLIDQDAAYIETAIVDPGADIVSGFGDGIMPDDYAEEIAPADLEALVAYLDEVTAEPK